MKYEYEYIPTIHMELSSLVLFVADLGVLISEDVVRGCDPLLLDEGNLPIF
jgi:hypothetical protein